MLMQKYLLFLYLINITSLCFSSNEEYDDEEETLQKLHQMKCIDNPNAPFDKYDWTRYNFDNKQLYKQCDTTAINYDIVSGRYERRKYPVSDKDFNGIVEFYKLLKDTQPILFTFNGAAEILTKYITHLDISITDVRNSWYIINVYDASMMSLEGNYKWIKELNTKFFQLKNVLKKYKDLIEFSERICSEGSFNEHDYERIDNSNNLEQEIESSWEAFIIHFNSLSQYCGNRRYAPPPINVAVANTLNYYAHFKEVILSKQLNLAEPLNKLKKLYNDNSNHDTYQSNLQKCTQEIEQITAAYQNTRNLLAQLFQREQSWHKFINNVPNYTDELTPEVLEEFIDQVNPFLGKISTVIGMNDDIALALEGLNREQSSVKQLHDSITIKKRTTLMSLELTMNMVQGIIDLARGEDPSQIDTYRSLLRKFSRNGYHYEFITSNPIPGYLSNNESFQNKWPKLRCMVDKVLNKVNAFHQWATETLSALDHYESELENNWSMTLEKKEHSDTNFSTTLNEESLTSTDDIESPDKETTLNTESPDKETTLNTESPDKETTLNTEADDGKTTIVSFIGIGCALVITMAIVVVVYFSVFRR